MKSISKFWLFISIGIAFLIYHLITLPLSPLPWFDEVIYASITKSYLDTGKLIWHDFRSDMEILTYGPVYFYIQGKIIGLLGYSAFSFRLLNLFAGASTILLLCFRFYRNIPDKRYLLILIGLLLLDTSTLQNLHSGRMDMVTIFFSTAGFILFFDYRDKKYTILLAAVLIGTAILTTPRIIFMVMPYAILFAYEFYIRKENRKVIFFEYATLGALLFIIYGSWIFLKFGSLHNFIDYYTQISIINNHIGGFTFIKHFYDVPPVLLFIVSTYILIRNKGKDINHKTTLFILWIFTSWICFKLLVNEGLGSYTAMINLFLYTYSITILAQYVPLTRLSQIGLGMILIFYATIFTLKNILIFSTRSYDTQQTLTTFINKNIPEHSKVIADPKYFYLTINHNCEYRLPVSQIYSTKVLAEELATRYQGQYLMVSQNSNFMSSDLAKNILKYKKIEKVAEMSFSKNQGNSNKFLDFTKKIGVRIDNSYDISIYQIKSF